MGSFPRVVVRVVVVLGGSCPIEGNCLGGNHPRGYLSRGVVVLGGTCPRG